MSARPPSVPHPNRALRDTSAVDPLEEIDRTVGGRTCIVLAIPRLEPSEDDDDLTLVRREAAILSGLRIT
eukprot:CAMPEP_0181180280 /NCGR_PEP_ID=MMETSP1096-20121128/6713_1 /TAXON_ID=156174 ORGANISM="Chrysochromulina ericina, Strain CCMP281" /NCGR_SAMPLE_ID=MMETSP1096 /ASSEMBLY_ACC=CAM_ASM_000453 /LENGTH=69 /DNA_ID=CAMNT_0023268693 /DNA_START=875 /DNA_END=1084 /DNA_ORIENTATION=-